MDKQTEIDEVLEGYRRIAFGDVKDPVRLIFLEKPTAASIKSMDLFNVASIKKAGERVEVSFYDRMAALEKLRELHEMSEGSNDFLKALNRAAKSRSDLPED